ncbi:glycoside hydrolase family 13 protein [Piedraia hortae CBS 480.64]|uniref:Glycoside hydrolase family 13 protein n=1 Tax=Piedraia hortae CBS 480.64 TaxID=1314780 RepID=A0A6A7C283_9PEZI|nr:glycoside hydrolase family 13 protein [Piedraia hortae CBS 480.64]
MMNHTRSVNPVLFQAFEWHTPSTPPTPHEKFSDSSHWARIKRLLPGLAPLGITAIWLPPGCKANDPCGNGYDCYDLWDLGEFDQKWARSTKWGSREELDAIIQSAKELGIDCIWDAVLNHKTAGDATEVCWAVEVDPDNRCKDTCTPKQIESWLQYDFPGRDRAGMPYSTMKWRAEHFNGTDWDERSKKGAIYKIVDGPVSSNPLSRIAGKIKRDLLGKPGKDWADDVSNIHGNHDYLLFCNIYHKNPEVRQDLLKWGQWMVKDVGVKGFRLDAVQHFSYNFSREWVQHVQRSGPVFIVGEVWTHLTWRILEWLDKVGPTASAYDAPLLCNFSRIGEDVRNGSPNADLRTILRDCLVTVRPDQAVTVVTNHDTQIGQTSFTPMYTPLKPLWYAFILLRKDGYPCVFWGDLYGTQGPHAEPPSCIKGEKKLIPELLRARQLFAHGPQTDYIDDAACIGWTRNDPEKGCAVVLSIAPEDETSTKKMKIGTSGEMWMDLLGDREVCIDNNGEAEFPVSGRQVAVFVKKQELSPLEFDLNCGI